MDHKRALNPTPYKVRLLLWMIVTVVITGAFSVLCLSVVSRWIARGYQLLIVVSMKMYVNGGSHHCAKNPLTDHHWNSHKYLCRGDGGGGHWLVRMEWRPAGWSVCLRLLVFPCAIKSRSSLLAPAHPGGPGKRAVKWLCWLCRGILLLCRISCFTLHCSCT